MKKNTLCLFMLLLLGLNFNTFAQGVMQQGVAYFYNYKTKTKTPVSGVQLTVMDAQPTTSGEGGVFSLKFGKDSKVGDKIPQPIKDFTNAAKEKLTDSEFELLRKLIRKGERD